MILKITKIIIVFVFMFTFVSISSAEETKTLTAGVSLNEQMPPALMGTWRVVSKIQKTDSPENFKKSGVDIWNLSKTGDVINLSNPFTGATASIRIDYVKNNTVKFTKEGNYDNQKLTDTVEITLDGSKFEGTNYLSLKKISPVGGSVTSEKTATYALQGNKISGTSILEK